MMFLYAVKQFILLLIGAAVFVAIFSAVIFAFLKFVS